MSAGNLPWSWRFLSKLTEPFRPRIHRPSDQLGFRCHRRLNWPAQIIAVVDQNALPPIPCSHFILIDSQKYKRKIVHLLIWKINSAHAIPRGGGEGHLALDVTWHVKVCWLMLLSLHTKPKANTYWTGWIECCLFPTIPYYLVCRAILNSPGALGHVNTYHFSEGTRNEYRISSFGMW